MRTIVSILGLIAALTSCSEGTAPATVLGPGPTDPGGVATDPEGPTQDNLFGGAGGAAAGMGGSRPGGDVTTGASTGGGVLTTSGTTTGSGGTTGPLPNFSCELPSTASTSFSCIEVDSPTAAIVQSETQYCTSVMGTQGTGCPTAGALGSCTIPSTGGVVEKEFFSSTGTLTAAQAQSACTSESGTWTAG